MFVLRGSREFAQGLSDSLIAIKDKVAFCQTCWMFSETDPCQFCTDSHRDLTRVCVVEESGDVISIEKTGGWRGLYHVIGGAISPLEGIGPGQLRIDQLIERVCNGRIIEVLVATNPTTEGETTALYIARMLRKFEVRVTRIARGVPVGADLELVDDSTLQQSLEGRVEI